MSYSCSMDMKLLFALLLLASPMALANSPPSDPAKSPPSDPAKSPPSDPAKPSPSVPAKPSPSDPAKPSPSVPAKPSPSVPAIYIFGDSILDAGNNHFNKNCTAQADFPPYGESFFKKPTGRFTNGRTIADFISQFIGLPLQKPYMEMQNQKSNGTSRFPTNGINFASAGSGLLPDTNKDMVVTPIQTQLQQFQKLVEENKIDKSKMQESLFLVESGSTDVFNFFLPDQQTPKLSPEAYVDAMVVEMDKTIDQIYKLGARRIAVFSLGRVGCVPARALIPEAPTDKCFDKMTDMAKNFNKKLEDIVNKIPTKFPGAKAVFGSVDGITHTFQTYPSRFGFKDVSNACCGEGKLGGTMQCGKESYNICNNSNEFLFWDFYHPTERTYQLISKAFWDGNKNQIRPFNLKALATNKTV
ncbi:hypothetical protein AALP_AA2G142100 [Arabis alpina]|uniref:Uncharacterized protein n=1 Tax=Arabis alpina TaxID=50452 RepID=A0A087HHD5_ARAAL|nr:hypothetical protein AALP_AA2G142100 [Arabis alpina]